MAMREIDYSGLDSKTFMCNHKRGSDYKATIQNNTNVDITVLTTNGNVQRDGLSGVAFSTPAQGALVITAGLVGSLNDPYVAIELTSAAAADGSFVHIVEAG